MKKENFKLKATAKLAYDALLKNEKCYNVQIYRGHRGYVVQWNES